MREASGKTPFREASLLCSPIERSLIACRHYEAIYHTIVIYVVDLSEQPWAIAIPYVTLKLLGKLCIFK